MSDVTRHSKDRVHETQLIDRVGGVLLCAVAGALSLMLTAGSILTLWATQFWLFTPISVMAVGLIAFGVLRQHYVAAFMAGVVLLSVNFGLGAFATIHPHGQTDVPGFHIQ